MPKYAFEARYGDWPNGKPARQAVLTVTDRATGHVLAEYRLTAGQARSLAREALRALAFTKIKRRDGQWEATWMRQIEKTVDPIMAVISAFLPKDTKDEAA